MTPGKSAHLSHLSLCSSASWNHPINAVVLRVLSESPRFPLGSSHTSPNSKSHLSSNTPNPFPVQISSLELQTPPPPTQTFPLKGFSNSTCAKQNSASLPASCSPPLLPYLSTWHRHIPFPQQTQNSPPFLCPSQPVTKRCPYSLTSSEYESSYLSIAIVTLQHPFVGLSLNPYDEVTQERGGRAGI